MHACVSITGVSAQTCAQSDRDKLHRQHMSSIIEQALLLERFRRNMLRAVHRRRERRSQMSSDLCMPEMCAVVGPLPDIQITIGTEDEQDDFRPS